MKRQDLLKSGTYNSIPNDILASKTLRSRAKIVYAALLGHLGENLCTWPSFPRLMAETGMAKQTLVDALADLEQAGFIAVDNSRKHHRTNAYILYDLATAAERITIGSLTTVYSLDGKDGLKSRRQTRNDSLRSRRSQSKVQTPGRSNVQTATVQSLDGHSLKSRPELLKELQKEQRKTEPPQEPPQPSGGLASPDCQDGVHHSTISQDNPPLAAASASGGSLQAVPAPGLSPASGRTLLPSEAQAPASGVSVLPEATESQEKKNTQPAAPSISQLVRTLWEQAKRAGLDMPTGEQAKRTACENLKQCIQEMPLFRYIWPSIVHTLASRKGFSSKNLSWLTNYKRDEMTGKPKWNWQMVAHWEFDKDNNCYNHGLLFDNNLWNAICPNTPFSSEARWDLLEATIGAPVGRYKQSQPSPWNRKYIGSAIPFHHGALCRALKSLGGESLIVFFNEDNTPYTVSDSDLIHADDELPQKPTTDAGEDDGITDPEILALRKELR